MDTKNTGASKQPANPFTRKLWLGLTVGVLLVHLYLLRAAPLSLGVSPPPPSKPFITRTVGPAKVAHSAATSSPLPKPRIHPRSAHPLATKRAAPPAPPATVSEHPLPVPAPAESAPAAPDESATPEPVPVATPATLAEKPATAKTGAVLVPGAALVKYKVEASKFPYSAQGELLWQQDGNVYKAQLAFSAFGQTRMQTSQGQITPEGLAPVRFTDKYRSEVAAHFNREQGKVSFSANTPDVPLLAGAQDRLSVILQLAALIAANPAQYAPAATVTLQVVSARDADTWLFTVGEEETLSLAGGEQRTLKLVRSPRQAFDQKVELWLGTQLDYLPVRLKITEANGDFIDQKWLSVEAPP